MGLWSTVVKFITGSNSAGKVVDTGLDLIKEGASGIDVLFHTSEEKAHEMAANAGKIVDHALDMNKLANEGNSTRSATRRALAFAISGVALSTFLWCVAMLSWAYFVKGSKQDVANAQLFVKDVVTTSEALYVGPAFTAVVILFFGYYGLSKLIGKQKN